MNVGTILVRREATVLNAQTAIDRRMLDALLRTLPAHVLLFDSELNCRYAAPNGGHFLGKHPDALLGQPIDRVFPPAIEIRPFAERVRRTLQPWHAEHVAYPAGPRDSWPSGAWTVHAQPLMSAKHGTPARPSSGAAPSVLISCYECACDKTLGHARATKASALATTAAQAFWAGAELERNRAAALTERVRTKLTVIQGFAQLLRRRLNRTRPPLQALELDRISAAIGELDALLGDFESAPRPVMPTGSTLQPKPR
ncbi:MAG: PAS domain-containing protein [Dehalococcoidia bacterium]